MGDWASSTPCPPPTPLPQVLSPSGSAGIALLLLLLLLLLQGKSNKQNNPQNPQQNQQSSLFQNQRLLYFPDLLLPLHRPSLCPWQGFQLCTLPGVHTELRTPEQSSRWAQAKHSPSRGLHARGKVTAVRMCHVSLSCPEPPHQPLGTGTAHGAVVPPPCLVPLHRPLLPPSTAPLTSGRADVLLPYANTNQAPL